jgi:hypothetical protein
MDFGREDYNKYLNNIYNIDGTERVLPFNEDEPVFLIRGGDPVGPQLLMEYAKQISLSGTDPEVAKSAFTHALKMLEWQKSHGSNNVDLMRTPEGAILEKSRINQIIELIEIDTKLSEKVFDELTSLFDKIYGPNKLRVCMPHELRAITTPPGFEPLSSSDALLTLGVIDNKIIILSNKL